MRGFMDSALPGALRSSNIEMDSKCLLLAPQGALLLRTTSERWSAILPALTEVTNRESTPLRLSIPGFGLEPLEPFLAFRLWKNQV